MQYLVLYKNGDFGFFLNGFDGNMPSPNVPISDEVYNQFFEYQSQGKQFKIKDISGTTFEEIFQEYIPNLEPYQPTQSDMIMEAIAQLDAQREKDKLDNQIAIAELANTLLGGMN